MRVMVKVNVFVADAPRETSGQSPFRIRSKLHMSRIPCVGELIAIGEDDNGIAADYRVELVHHVAMEQPHPEKVAADVYAVRVTAMDFYRAAEPKEAWQSTAVKADPASATPEAGRQQGSLWIPPRGDTGKGFG
jgi:hypothetical protein